MLQNRVDPWGQLRAVPYRGTLMGNRGILHDSQNRIVRPWDRKSWVACLLSYKGITRPKPFSQGNYSELFFLDEATAFAAGHRPCTFCQRERSKLFKDAWVKANLPADERAIFPMRALDAWLHGDRVAKGGAKVTFEAQVSELPSGALFAHAGAAYLVDGDRYLPWSFEGYSEAQTLSPSTGVSVLTPRSVVAAIRHGFHPLVHSSAGAVG